MKTMLSPDDSDDDADDCGAASSRLTHNRTGDPQIPQASNNSSRNYTESHPANLPPAFAPLLLKSRIHAGGVPVVHELARGVPGFWGPPASVVAHLYAALGVQS